VGDPQEAVNYRCQTRKLRSFEKKTTVTHAGIMNVAAETVSRSALAVESDPSVLEWIKRSARMTDMLARLRATHKQAH
jgi:hypothetical protein